MLLARKARREMQNMKMLGSLDENPNDAGYVDQQLGRAIASKEDDEKRRRTESHSMWLFWRDVHGALTTSKRREGVR